MEVHDAIIIGAGPAGSIAALVLATMGRSVLLLDLAEKSRKRIGESLSPAASPLLQELQLLGILEGQKHLPAHGNASSWMREELDYQDFIQNPLGSGWHLDRQTFDQNLRDEAMAMGAHFKSEKIRAFIANKNFGPSNFPMVKKSEVVGSLMPVVAPVFSAGNWAFKAFPMTTFEPCTAGSQLMTISE